MTKTNMDLSELLAKHDQGDFLRGIAEAVLQLIMETDVEGIIGAGRHERSGDRTTWRNGYRAPSSARQRARYTPSCPLVSGTGVRPSSNCSSTGSQLGAQTAKSHSPVEVGRGPQKCD